MLQGHGSWWSPDEIYAELTYGRTMSPSPISSRYVSAPSWSTASQVPRHDRLAHGLCLRPWTPSSQMLKLHQFGIMSAPHGSQYAAIEAMRNGDMDIEKMRDEYDGRRRYLVEGLRRIGLPCFEPKGAFYVFPDIRGTGLSSDEFCERFLMEGEGGCDPGSAFGAGGEGLCPLLLRHQHEGSIEALTRLDNFPDQPEEKQARGADLPISEEKRMYLPGHGGRAGPGDLDRLCRGQRHPGAQAHHRDEPDYNKLMQYRLDILREHGLGLKEIQETIANH